MRRYGMSVLGVTVALLANLLLDRVVPRNPAYLPFAAAVLAAAWYGGTGPAVLALGLGAALTSYLDAPPVRRPADDLPAAVFLAEGAVLIWAVGRLRAARGGRDSTPETRILEAANEGAWDWNVRTGEVYYSPQWIAALDYCPQDVVPHVSFWESALHPDDAPRAKAALRDHLDGRTPAYACENRLRTKSGGWRWILDRGKVVERDPAGRPVRMVGTSTDVTDRKLAEEALRSSERRLQLVADAIPGLVAYVDADHRYRFANATYEAWCGVPKEACLGRHVREVLGDQAYAAIQGSFDGIAAGRPGSFEARITYPVAGPKDVHIYQVPDRGPDGRVVGVYVLVVDVTPQREAERAVRDREGRLRAVVETAADAIITIDGRGAIESFNPAAERMFGYPAAEVVGRNVSVLMPGPYRDEHDGYLDRYLRTGEKKVIGIGREVVGRRRDGSVFPVDLAVSEIDHSKSFTGILRDVSGRKELEREVLEVAGREQRRIGQELHDGVGQELTGLALMAAALAQQLGTRAPDEAARAGRIAAGLEEAHAHIRALARGLVPVLVDPEGLRAALEDLADRTAQQTGVRCTFEMTGSVRVTGPDEATHLFRVAQEAVSNALRHARAGRIRIALRCSPDALTLEVRDDGVGIAAPADERRGLGVRLMRYRCGAIGGTITLRPADGGGTVVACVVPGRRDHGTERPPCDTVAG